MKKANKRSGRSFAKSPKSSARASSLRQTDSCDRVAKIDGVVWCSVRATRQPELRTLIQSARQRIATVACSTQSLLCWHMGRRLSIENLQGGRAAYGKQILVTVSRELTDEFGQAFTLRSLYRAIQFCQCFTDQEIVSTLSTQLSWSHFIELLPIKDPLAREFYAEMCLMPRINHE